MPTLYLIPLFQSLNMAFITNTATATLIPAKACCTDVILAKFLIKAAIIMIITSDGKTTPS
jgi:hypothetical protein